MAAFSAKHWYHRNRADLIESAHDAQVVGPYRVSNTLRPTVLTTTSEEYTTAPQLFTNTVSYPQNPQLNVSYSNYLLNCTDRCTDLSDNLTLQICAPIALFHAKKDGRLMPIAIQLFQEPSETNPVTISVLLLKFE